MTPTRLRGMREGYDMHNYTHLKRLNYIYTYIIDVISLFSSWIALPAPLFFYDGNTANQFEPKSCQNAVKELSNNSRGTVNGLKGVNYA